MVDSVKCTVFMSKIPDTSQKVYCAPSKDYISFFLLIALDSASKVIPNFAFKLPLTISKKLLILRGKFD